MVRKGKKKIEKNIPAPASTTSNASSPATPQTLSESKNVFSPGTQPRNLAVQENRENPMSARPHCQQFGGRNQLPKGNQGPQNLPFSASSHSTTAETLGERNTPPSADRAREFKGQSPSSSPCQRQEKSQGQRPAHEDKWGKRQPSGQYQRPGYGGRRDYKEYPRRQGGGYNQGNREIQHGQELRGQQATESRERPQPQRSISRSFSEMPPAWRQQPISNVPKSPIKEKTALKNNLQRASHSGTSTEPCGQVQPDGEDGAEIPFVYKEPGTLAMKRIQVQSNHFALNLGDLKEAYQYDVKIQENQMEIKQEQKNQQKRGAVSRNRKIKNNDKLKVMKVFLEKHFPGRYPAFDGNAIMYASKPLDPDLHHVINDMDIEISDNRGNSKSFHIEVQCVKLLDLKPLPSTQETPVHFFRDVHQCIEVIFKNAPSTSFTQIGRGYFRKPEGQVINLGPGLEMYHGFTQSVVMGGQWEKMRPLLNIHLAHKGFHKNQEILKTFVEILNKTGTTEQFTVHHLNNLSNKHLNILNDYIVNLRVSYQVPHSPRKTYKVTKLSKSPMEEKLSDGTTIFEYFQKYKRYTIKYPNIPLLKVGAVSSNIMIPPELCVVEKDQSASRKLDSFLARNLIKVASTDTKRHRENTMRRFEESHFDTSPHLREFDFSVSAKLEVTNARVLPPPSLLYNNKVVVKVHNGVWKNDKSLKQQKISKWAILNLDYHVEKEQLNTFVKELKKASRYSGTTFDCSSPDYLQLTTRSSFGFTLKDFEEFFKTQKNKGYNIIFVVLPRGFIGDRAYENVKNAAEIITGCLTQCIKASTLSNIKPTTAMNLLLKDNAKLNGTNYIFSIDTKPLILKGPEPFMLLGADVTHPGPTAAIPCSIAATVASHDPTGFHYNFKFRFQTPGMEEIHDFKNIMIEHLMFFYKKTNIKPTKIIYFRDGVAEGQYSKVKALELAGIMNACKEIQKDGYEPKVAFLVVQKTHHTRLFPVNDEDSVDCNFNIPPGTCVDTNIVNPGLQNFLLSHASIKGTSRPTKYTTIYDDLNMSNDEIEELAYYLCHMFARCTRSVSYPAPTYYAHLGAARAKAYLLAAINNKEMLDFENIESMMSKFKVQSQILDENPMFFI